MKKHKVIVADFETTVYDNQDETEVWASACVELYTEDVKIFTSIEAQFTYFLSLDCNMTVYYHNLKFDGEFWMYYLLNVLHLKQAIIDNGENNYPEFYDRKTMPDNSFMYTISDLGQWYSITIKYNGKYIDFRDSYKLLPFTVERIGKAFKTKHQKLSIEYKGFRRAGGVLTEEEKMYIANDVLVVKEALETMYNDGHDKMTIGSCCLYEFKKQIGKEDWNMYFPDMTVEPLDTNLYAYDNVDAYIRKSYKGGWCYVVEGKENKIYDRGTTADVNSLYPSMMHSQSGNYYPVGRPTFWKGNFIPPEAEYNHRYYFVRIKTRFYLKENMLPFLQIKTDFRYRGNVCLKTSDVYDEKKGWCQYTVDRNGVIKDTRVTLTLTMTDYQLLKEHYELVDFEILDGCWFHSEIGLFDIYINKYKKIKQESTGAVREEAKLFLNNLYGKLASSTDSSFKIAYVKENGVIGYRSIPAHDKDAGYIPIGSAITSYARNFTIRSAQKNYYGADKRGFIYADTDSIHCDLEPDEIKGITVHDTEFCCWKLEAQWDKAIFARQKTYIEHVVAENQQPIDTPYYNVKCAGMPKKCKDLFLMSLQGYTQEEYEKLDEIDKKFVRQKRELTDFKTGLTVFGKLVPKRIKGGVVLVETTFEMR